MGNGLSFQVSQSELFRQMVGAKMGVAIDPRGRGDLIMLIGISIVYAFNFLVVGFMLWNRHYPPLKSKNPLLMTAFMATSVLWFVGDLQTNGHVPLAHTALQHCKAFGVWVRVLLGVCTLGSLIALRSYGLYRVFCQNLPYRGLGLYLPFFFYCMCMVIYGVVSQLVSPQKTIMYVEVIDICRYHSAFKASLFAFVWVTWLIIAALNWKIRNIKSSFNESREMMIACICVFTVMFYTTIMHYTHPTFALSMGLRISTTTLDHVATNMTWWSIMAVPIYKCMFDRRRYLNSWLGTLRQDGMQRAYDVDSGAGGDGKGSLNSAHVHNVLLNNNVSTNKDGGFFYSMDEAAYENGGALDGSKLAAGRKEKMRVTFAYPPESPVFDQDMMVYDQDTIVSLAAFERQQAKKKQEQQQQQQQEGDHDYEYKHSPDHDNQEKQKQRQSYGQKVDQLDTESVDTMDVISGDKAMDHNDPPPRPRPKSPRLRPLSNDAMMWGTSVTESSNRYLVQPTSASQLYMPINFQENTASAPLRLSAGQDVRLDPYNLNERQLI
ncbi:hypothetical protein GGI07_005440 [Coemansia sp. Benny D115]|nr:hypothetical protein GGI07_005440 [Coemansia sp. Benny D115]